MSMEMLASLLRELLKEGKALQAAAKGRPLPGAVAQETAAKILGCSLRTLQREIRSGRVQTVTVGDREHVPMTEIARFAELRQVEAERARASRKRRRSTQATSRRSAPKRKGKPKGRGAGR